MVQELMFENSPTMFPGSRQPLSQAPYSSMNLQAFGYPQQNLTSYATPEYSQYTGDGSVGLQQSGAGVVTSGAGSWSGMYGTSPPGPPHTTSTRSGSSPAMEDWTTTFMQSQNMIMGGNPNSPSGGSAYGYHRPAGMPHSQQGSIPVSADLSPYGQQASQSPVPPMQGIAQSPSPSSMMVPVPQGTPGTPHTSRQTSRAPYDWMKKNTYPAAPNAGGCLLRKSPSCTYSFTRRH